jgi:peptidoglycan hydrolase-like protein with peptidoglycan-binding domain
MYVLKDSLEALAPEVREEVAHPGDLARGAKGAAVKRVQEWLNLHGFGLAPDGDFGPITEEQVQAFQTARGVQPTGRVEAPLTEALVAPMLEALHGPAQPPADLNAAILAHAQAHLRQHPREMGGDNRGPWVRLYMDGQDGPNWFWCAGFVRFLLRQAAETMATDMPLDGSVSCDVFAQQGRDAGLFLAEGDAATAPPEPGSVFLLRRSPTDWFHAGLVSAVGANGFATIEGNTNDDGSSNGYEVCSRRRSFRNADFVLLRPRG